MKLTLLLARTILVVVVALPLIVHSATATPGAEDALPEPVQRMRDALLEAAISGDPAQLQIPVELNELPPMLGAGATADANAFARSVSRDGNGREILAVIVNLLTSSPRKRIATDSSEALYLWPSFAETDLGELSAAEDVTLLRLLPPQEAERMKANGRYDGWRIGIGENGVWHFLEDGKSP